MNSWMILRKNGGKMKIFRIFLLCICLLMWGSGCALLSKPAPDPVKRNNLGMDFVYIPPGKCVMGSPIYQPGRFADEVRYELVLTKGYYLQTTEVTQGQWEAVMHNDPAYFRQCGANCPVENVSWNDVQKFIDVLNQKGNGHYRLPTESEWEYACQLSKKKNVFYRTVDWGFGIINNMYYFVFKTELIRSQACLTTAQANYNAQYPCAGCPQDIFRGSTLPVASLDPDKLGLYDMLGNVNEWCQDDYGPYDCRDTIPLYRLVDPVGTSGSNYKVYRGGSWMSCFRYCRPACRGKAGPGHKGKNIGFRLVKDAAATSN